MNMNTQLQFPVDDLEETQEAGQRSNVYMLKNHSTVNYSVNGSKVFQNGQNGGLNMSQSEYLSADKLKQSNGTSQAPEMNTMRCGVSNKVIGVKDQIMVNKGVIMLKEYGQKQEGQKTDCPDVQKIGDIVRGPDGKKFYPRFVSGPNVGS